MSITTIVGVAASLFSASSLIPELVKIIKSKKAKEISFLMLAVMFASQGLWVWYGILKKDWIIIISNAISLGINTASIIFRFKYKAQ